jgi:PST family polysaccharide transporter
MMAFRSLKIQPVLPSWSGIHRVLADGWELFLSVGAVSLYTAAGNVVVLGLLTNYTIVGYYGAAERVVRVVVRGFTMPISQAVYPRFSKMATEAKTKVLHWARRMLFFMGGVGLLLSLLLFALAPFIVDVFVGPEFQPSVQIIRILAFLPLIVGIGSVLGRQIMLPFRRDRARLLIFCVAGVTNIVLALLLVPAWQGSGTALAAVTTEVFVTMAFFVYLSVSGLSPLVKYE